MRYPSHYRHLPDAGSDLGGRLGTMLGLLLVTLAVALGVAMRALLLLTATTLRRLQR